MFRRIMVPVDGSSFAEHSLPFAVALARRAGAQLDLALVHVRYMPAAPDMGLLREVTEWDSRQKQQEADYLHNLAGRVHSDEHVDVRPHLLAGEVVPALEETVREIGADMVVMTTHARTGLERAWLGSVADGLLRHLDVPILLIHPSDDEPVTFPDGPRYQHVLIPLDGSDLAASAIEPALELAPEARVTLMRVALPPAVVASPYLPHAARLMRERTMERESEARAYVDQQVQRLRTRGIDAAGVVVMDPIEADAILVYARDNGVDLIAMGTHARNPLLRLLLGSVTDRVVRGAAVPVLVC